MVNLGLLLADNDPEQARRWYGKAAEAEDAPRERISRWLRGGQPTYRRRPPLSATSRRNVLLTTVRLGRLATLGTARWLSARNQA